MGVDLRDMLEPTVIALEDLAGRALAIDAYNALYQFLAIIRGEAGEHLMDRKGRVTSHLSGLFYRNMNLLLLGIRPIYVLDGQPPALKAMEIERRRAAKTEAAARYVEALSRGNLEEARKQAQATSALKDYMVEDTKRMLSLLGIPWVEAPSEGEATAAHLASVEVAFAAASQDFDSLLFGAPRLARNINISGKRKLPGRAAYVEVQPEQFELTKVLSDLSITQEQLVDVGILVGTDFNPNGFRGVGPAKALKYIRMYGRLEDIPEIRDDLARLDYQAVREIFLRPKVTVPQKTEWGEVDETGVIDFLCRERDFSEDRVKNALLKLRDARRKKLESLDQWFA